MTSFQDRYQQKVKARAGNQVERSYKCLCCRDQALIPADVIRLYIDPDFDAGLLGEVAFFCRYDRCEANDITINVENGTREVRRYASWSASNDISPDRCQEIHFLEWERLREANERAQASPSTPAIATAAAIIDNLAINRNRARAKVEHTFDQLEAIMSTAAPAKTLQQHLDQKRVWLHDPVLKNEAIQWAIDHPGIELVTDDEGTVADLRLAPA